MQQTSLARLLARDQSGISNPVITITHGKRSEGWLTLPSGRTVAPRPSLITFTPEPIVFTNSLKIRFVKKARQCGLGFLFMSGVRHE
ncbi:Uncharacterised protein [Budvicia aquatica]|uniref:Uncharacterized protein n=1 Tax=Budvicia aquatica TaxID=82979 RepID=A0A2C6DL95_9GAMM|nr:hypothetical protein CRN84_07780 [Budvicia aquatica]VFS47435.1 Uncharacterised protein [Budvicia aquatica]